MESKIPNNKQPRRGHWHCQKCNKRADTADRAASIFLRKIKGYFDEKRYPSISSCVSAFYFHWIFFFFFKKFPFNNSKKAFWDFSEFKFECLLCFCRPAHFAAYDAIRESALKGEDFEIIVSKMRSEAFKTVRMEQENSCIVCFN